MIPESFFAAGIDAGRKNPYNNIDNQIPYKERSRDGPDDTRQPAEMHGGKSRSVHTLADKVEKSLFRACNARRRVFYALPAAFCPRRYAQMREAGAKSGHTDGLVDYAIDLEGVMMAYFARETEDGRVKVSLRALEPCRVDQVAARFGGGGHRLASGLTVDMPLSEAAQAVEAALAEAFGSVNA